MRLCFCTTTKIRNAKVKKDEEIGIFKILYIFLFQLKSNYCISCKKAVFLKYNQTTLKIY